MFLHPWLAPGRKTDGGYAMKSGATEIFQRRPTDLCTLENADHQNAIVILPPKTHPQFYTKYRLADIGVIDWRKLLALPSKVSQLTIN
jgi:hypothetical protein